MSKLNSVRLFVLVAIVLSLALGLADSLRPSVAQADGGAVRSGFNGNGLPGNDDGSTPNIVPIGFNANFLGRTYSGLWVNNNGNVTFDGPAYTYTPYNLTSTNHVIIAPFFADVDTRSGAAVAYGTGQVDGHNAFGVTWPGVGCYYMNSTVRNYFQVILIDRSDIGSGNFDIEFNYDQIQWEAGIASGADAACLGGYSARAGYSNGSGAPGTFFELNGSGVNGAFLDSNTTTGLIHHSSNSSQLGRYVFTVRNGRPRQADLSIEKRVAPTIQSVGGPLNYTIKISNDGPDPATNVVLVDNLPAGVSSPSASWNAPITGCTTDGSTVTCYAPILDPGSINSAQVNIHGTATSPGVMANTAAVSANEIDVTPINNTATATATVTASDLTPPIIMPAVAPAPNALDWNSSPVTVTWTVSDPESGMASSTGCGPTTLVNDTAGTTLTCTATNTVGLSASQSVTVRVDQTGPTITGAATTSPNAYGWYSGSVTIHFTCSDSISSITSCGPDVVLSSEDANQSATGTAIDSAGNTSTATVSGIDIDNTPPGVRVSQTPARNANGWNNTDVTVVADGGDSISGIESCTTITLNAEGANQSATVSCTDKAGNIASATLSGINIDKTPPTISATATTDPNADLWYHAPVTIHFTCSDLSGSGIATCPDAVTLSEDGADQSASGTAIDTAGNSTSVTISGINIDHTSPTIAGAPTTSSNASGWYSSSVTVEFTCYDALSGIVFCPTPVTLSSDGENQSVGGMAVDRAGNISTTAVSGINIDTAPP